MFYMRFKGKRKKGKFLKKTGEYLIKLPKFVGNSLRFIVA